MAIETSENIDNQILNVPGDDMNLEQLQNILPILNPRSQQEEVAEEEFLESEQEEFGQKLDINNIDDDEAIDAGASQIDIGGSDINQFQTDENGFFNNRFEGVKGTKVAGAFNVSKKIIKNVMEGAEEARPLLKQLDDGPQKTEIGKKVKTSEGKDIGEKSIGEEGQKIPPQNKEREDYNFEEIVNKIDESGDFRLDTYDPRDDYFNIPNFVGGDTSKNQIGIMTDNLAKTVFVKKTVTKEETFELSKKLGLDETFLNLVKSKKGQVFNSTEVYKQMQLVDFHGKYVDKLAKQVENNPLNAEIAMKFRKHFQLQGIIIYKFMNAKSELGRALNALKYGYDSKGLDVQDFKTMMADYGGHKSIQELASRYNQATISERNNMSLSTWDKFKTNAFRLFINSILSSARTLTTNFVGNILHGGLIFVDNASAIMVGKARVMLTNKLFTQADPRRMVPEELAIDVLNFKQNWTEFVTFGWRALKTKEYKLGGRKDTFLGNPADVDLENGSLSKKLNGYFWSGVETPGHVLMSTDEAFKAKAYRQELNRQAVREELEMTRAGASGEDIINRRQYILNGNDSVINDIAMQHARYATFTDVGDGLVAQGFIRAMQGLRSTFVGRLAVPFMHVLVNLSRGGWDRSPFGLLRKWSKIKDPIQKDVLLGRAIWGTSFMYYVSTLAQDHKITGQGPQNFDFRKQMLSLGWQPQSFVINKKGVEKARLIKAGDYTFKHPDDVDYISYARLEPLSIIMSLSEKLQHIIENDKVSPAAQKDLVEQSLIAVFDYFNSQKMLQGPANLVKIFEGREGEKSNELKKFIGSTISSFVPFSSLMGGASKVVDDRVFLNLPNRELQNNFFLKTADNAIKVIETKTLIVDDIFNFEKGLDYENLPEDQRYPRLDRFGKPLHRTRARIIDQILPPTLADVFSLYWFDGSDKSKKADPVMKKIVELGVPLNKLRKSIDGVKLNDKEYYFYQKLASNIPRFKMPSIIPSGTSRLPFAPIQKKSNLTKETITDFFAKKNIHKYGSLYEELKKEFSNNNFKKLPIEEQQDAVKSIISEFQEEAREIILYESRSPVIDEIFNDLRQAIKEKENYLKDNPVQVK